MSLSKRAPAWLAVLFSLTLVAAACGGDDEPEPGATGPTGETAEVTGGEWAMSICEPESLIPQINAETCGSQVLRSLFTPLVQFDENNELVFAVAESIESEDNVNWTITLRDGWTFHDGTPVTAQSFVDAWNWTAYSPNANGASYFFANVEGYADLQAPTDDEGNPTGDPKAQEMTGLNV